MLPHEITVYLAVRQAKATLREWDKGHAREAEKAHEKMLNLIAAVDYPHLVMRDVVLRLGRRNALNAGFDRVQVQSIMRDHVEHHGGHRA